MKQRKRSRGNCEYAECTDAGVNQGIVRSREIPNIIKGLRDMGRIICVAVRRHVVVCDAYDIISHQGHGRAS